MNLQECYVEQDAGLFEGPGEIRRLLAPCAHFQDRSTKAMIVKRMIVNSAATTSTTRGTLGADSARTCVVLSWIVGSVTRGSFIAALGLFIAQLSVARLTRQNVT
jgi:hypothetical protein